MNENPSPKIAEGDGQSAAAALAGRSSKPRWGLHRWRPAKKRPNNGNWLRDVILGGQDGLVNVLGISLGLSATTSDMHVVITAGLAAAITESISMGAVGYTSTLSERDYYLAERQRTLDAIKRDPQSQRGPVTTVLSRGGFAGQQMYQAVDTITGQPERWADVIMVGERHLNPVETDDLARTSVVIGLACLVGSLLPIMPFLVLSRSTAIPLCVVLAALTLFAVGVYQAKTTVGSWWKSGLRLMLIGLAAAAFGVLISGLFHTASS